MITLFHLHSVNNMFSTLGSCIGWLNKHFAVMCSFNFLVSVIILGLFHKCSTAAALSFLQFSGGSTLSAEQEAGFDWPRFGHVCSCISFFLALYFVFSILPSKFMYLLHFGELLFCDMFKTVACFWRWSWWQWWRCHHGHRRKFQLRDLWVELASTVG